ncbi:hypothetical protein [Pseudomonas sp. KBW05]|uniref:hypothetical protein n=1 Tax=Pseudomonas sp. KBW05 TaxID=2153360 RepID=UPI000F5ACDEF|nr:hypothetical protein [Pseudomonas sp. KBW05]RQO62240.1 hypothetical protein DBR46_00685 [Pseudomonas sp. KBW05]
MEKATEDELLNSARDYVAANMYLGRKGEKRESVKAHAKERLTQSSELLQQNGFLPHLRSNVPPGADPSNYLASLGGVQDVLIPHGKDNKAIRVNGNSAWEICRKLYLGSL